MYLKVLSMDIFTKVIAKILKKGFFSIIQE